MLIFLIYFRIESGTIDATRDLLNLGDNYNGNSIFHSGLNSTGGGFKLKYSNTFREKVRKAPQ